MQVDRAKSKYGERTIPLNQTAYETLSRLGQERQGPYVFPNPREPDSVPSTTHYLDTGSGLAGLPEAAQWGTISPLGP